MTGYERRPGFASRAVVSGLLAAGAFLAATPGHADKAGTGGDTGERA